MSLAVYTNGGFGIGLGHIYRVKEFLKKSKLKASFYSLNKPEFASGWELLGDVCLIDNKQELFDIKERVLLIDSFDGDLDASFLSSLRKHFYLCVIDDEALLDYYDVDILLCPSIYGDLLPYKLKNTSFFCAPFFIRTEFYNKQIKIKPKLENIVLTLGGSDDVNMSSKIIELLSPKLGNTKLLVVQGPAFKHDLSSLSGGNIFIYKQPKMSELMMRADLGIIACGQSAYEFFALKIPTLGLCVAKNQEKLYKYASKRGMLRASSLDDLVFHLKSMDLNSRLLMQGYINQFFKFNPSQLNSYYEQITAFLKGAQSARR